MSSEVTDLITALRNGTITLDQVATRFRERTWPRTRGPQPRNYLELAAAAQEDPPPDVPGSFDDVVAAYDRGELSDDEYDALAQAMAESMRNEDRRNGSSG